MTVSWNLDHDDPESTPGQSLVDSVLERLQQFGMTSHNFVSSDPIDDVLKRYDVFGLPAVLVFSADGKLAKAFEGDVTYERDVIPYVESLLRGSQ